jgi:hypothetical protein
VTFADERYLRKIERFAAGKKQDLPVVAAVQQKAGDPFCKIGARDPGCWAIGWQGQVTRHDAVAQKQRQVLDVITVGQDRVVHACLREIILSLPVPWPRCKDGVRSLHDARIVDMLNAAER